MKLFELYILRRICWSFLLSCLFIMLIAWTMQILQRINLVSNNAESITILCQISYLIFPTVIPMTVPFCFAMETTNVLTAMNRNAELFIIDNTGTSRITLIKPVLFFAILLSIFLFMLENTLEPKYRTEIKRLGAQAYLNLTLSSLEENLFFNLNNNFYIKVSKRNPNNTMQGIFAIDSSDPIIHRIYYAKSGFVDLEKKIIVLQKGEVHRKSSVSKDISIMKFDSYALDMQSLVAKQEITLKAHDQNLSFLLNPDPNNPSYRENFIGKYRSELHKRLTQWLFPIVFGLISILSIEKTSSLRHYRKVHPSLIALLLSFCVFSVFSYIIQGIEQSPSYIPILYLFFFVLSSILVLLIKKKYMKI
ncbi:permease [Candidatus Liberibacter solanacearum]|uniref:Putative permease n=1 Tax=Candidatus Liberibacter solanacearum TaxID=556287 RepID=A0A094Z0W4_9HYPH|nr:LptF/LptG family permease [Candidatus Liberibacter solanacearum]KGB27845.1 permease [Candidatus Liberibacter solanacearum]KJZ81118.1 permease [Candidatus Liberibacter solanacearum]KJZ82322.1 putative permease [Candidatus Liberibacter solanacearum]KQC49277.1 permease [Candidatus Liberibacter solanacearum]